MSNNADDNLADKRDITGLLRKLYQLMVQPEEGFQKQIDSFVRIGRDWLEIDHCVISRINNGIYTVISSNTDNKSLAPSDQIPLSDTLCMHVLEKADTVAFSKLESDKQYYNGHVIKSYIGTKLTIDNRIYGTLCFWNDTIRKQDFLPQDYEALELIAAGVAKCIDLTAQSPSLFQQQQMNEFDDQRDKVKGNAMIADPSTLFHSDQSFTQEALECLAKRVGHTQLNITNLADDMAMSTRTLQRRFQENNISFGELRDHVRYRYAITRLIDKNITIESIAAALDFADRTSFTTAFKRWTGLSPSTFRRVYKRYN